MLISVFSTGSSGKVSLLFAFFLFVGWFAAIPFTCLSATYYVSSSDGDDGNMGTAPAAPWKTLKKVGSKTYVPGDRIVLKRGDVWHESLVFSSSGTRGKEIVISAYGEGKNPLINGSTVVDRWAPSGVGVYTSPYTGSCNGLLEDSKPLKRASSQALGDGQWFFDGSTIYYRPVSGMPGGRIVERCARGSLLHMKEQRHVIIEGITFYGANSYGIRIIDGSDIVIRNCRVLNNGQDGISLQRTRPELKCGRIRITGNTLEYNANGIYITGREDGFGSDGYDHCEIKDNVITHTNHENAWGHATKDGHAVGIQNSSFCRVEGNTITANYSGIALWTADLYLSRDNVVTRNYVADNHLYGIVHGANGKNNSWGHIFSFNIIAGNGHWPGQWGGLRINRVQEKGNRYFNNTLYNNDINIYLYSFPDHHVIRNNVSLEPVRYHVWLDNSAGRLNVMDNNCYLSRKTDAFHARVQGGISFAQWKARTGQDRASIFSTSILPARHPRRPEDFCLARKSPCSQKTVNERSPVPAKDFFGNSLSGPLRAGACFLP